MTGPMREVLSRYRRRLDSAVPVPTRPRPESGLQEREGLHRLVEDVADEDGLQHQERAECEPETEAEGEQRFVPVEVRTARRPACRPASVRLPTGVGSLRTLAGLRVCARSRSCCAGSGWPTPTGGRRTHRRRRRTAPGYAGRHPTGPVSHRRGPGWKRPARPQPGAGRGCR
jgi:hypothetical protein